MLESRSYYHPMGERGATPYKWCVKFVVAGADHGVTGMSSKTEAQKWLEDMVEYIKQGRIFQGFKLEDTAVYYAR